MKLYAYKAPQGNFGDDLNEWIWPKLFGAQMLSAPATTLIGIGSVLDKHFLGTVDGHKIIFGTGIRSVGSLPNITDETTIKFVRGPISALAIGNHTKWITDPAILISKVANRPSACGKYIGVMPHYHSVPLLNWEKLASDHGLLYIDPRSSVEKALEQFWQCDRIVTEAMHGAIVADALRIPWARFSLSAWQHEGFDVSSLKWLDWGLSAEVDVTPIHVGSIPQPPPSALFQVPHFLEKYRSRRSVMIEFRKLLKAPKYTLSSETKFHQLLQEVLAEVDSLNTWLKGNPAC